MKKITEIVAAVCLLGALNIAEAKAVPQCDTNGECAITGEFFVMGGQQEIGRLKAIWFKTDGTGVWIDQVAWSTICPVEMTFTWSYPNGRPNTVDITWAHGYSYGPRQCGTPEVKPSVMTFTATFAQGTQGATLTFLPPGYSHALNLVKVSGTGYFARNNPPTPTQDGGTWYQIW